MSKEELKVEYLITVNADSDFCADIEGFNSLIESNKYIRIVGEKIHFKGIEVKYEINTDCLEKEKQRFFYTKFKFGDVKKIKDFENLLSSIKEIIFKTGNKPQTLWDDISFYYSTEAYPLIFEVENLMRKLITQFMLTNVGLGWAKENIPAEVKDSVKGSKDETPDFLYKTDFIQLENFLFKKYSTKQVHKLLENIKNAKNENELKLDELRLFVPMSNWEKHFSKIVECDEEYLRKRWGRLYDLRNKIAHNRGLIRKEYEETIKLVGEVKDKLQKAIKGLETISLTKAEREEIAESTDLLSVSQTFIARFGLLLKVLDENMEQFDLPGSRISGPNEFLTLIDTLTTLDIISHEQYLAVYKALGLYQELQDRSTIITDTLTIKKISESLLCVIEFLEGYFSRSIN
ncbi:hypothetical protein [Bacillus cereus group sp. MYBK104-1]|uniref:hypothetical protein n=1 Tax=unclassified Bacillus cereus group TaxID=2750818 RepID=UPI003F78B3F1